MMILNISEKLCLYDGNESKQALRTQGVKLSPKLFDAVFSSLDKKLMEFYHEMKK